MNLSYLSFQPAAPGTTELVEAGSDEDSADARILHDAAAEAQRREAGDNRDVSELFGDSETEKETGVSTRSLKLARAAVAETSDFKPEKRSKAKRVAPTRKSTRAQTSKSSAATSKSSHVAIPTSGRQKQRASSK